MPENRKMDIIEKKDLLAALTGTQRREDGTFGSTLVKDIQKLEDELEAALKAEKKDRMENQEYLTSGVSSDCKAVKRFEAELILTAPKKNEKAMNSEETKSWMERQRTENKAFADIISKQKMASFLIEDHQIKIDMARTRLNGLRSILALRTAQISFLAGDVLITINDA